MPVCKLKSGRFQNNSKRFFMYLWQIIILEKDTSMKNISAALLSVGDEILIGQITDTNAVFLAEQLTLKGVQVNEMQTVGDSRRQIFDALDCALRRNDIVLLTGGLGPTDDDLTKAVLSEYFNTQLVLNKEVLADVEGFILSRGFQVNERNRKQALVPEKCKVIRNSNGTAPGMWFEHKGSVVVSMPAVPFEMKEMFSDKVLPLLEQHFDFPSIVHRTILTHGIAESRLAEMLEDFEAALHKDVKLAYLPSPERLRLRLSLWGKSKEKGEEILENEIRKLKKIIGKAIYGEGNYFLEQTVFKLLKERNATLATGESCTGGSISAKITSLPGSSQVFLGGTVAYSNQVKSEHLNVPESLIEKHGAVSQEVVEAMAEGALERFGSDYSIAVSGIAGPEGGTQEKPVGTVWIAVAGKNKLFSKKYTFGKRRNINIQRASAKALDMLRKFILDFYEK